ncbi:MAG: hypothetical protein HKN23_18830 [Verrucomicrobiales bacterium]|nr:hypothetical protein [Verrucomicrobiales bacterium]
MSFLAPLLLWGLPLAALPVIIHLINQHRHRTVKWAAMMFLLDAKRMTKGMARLRQILILAMRVLAILALVFALGRPLASGWVALTAGGAPDTVLVLLDRSASMEQQNLLTGESKRSTALEKIADLIDKVGRRTRVVLIENTENRPIDIEEAANLVDLPATWPTDTTSDVPAMLETALDYITTNETGRTDVWLASDLRGKDWDPGSGRWDSIRAAFSSLEGVRFYLLNYPDIASDNISVTIDNVSRRKIGDQAQLQMDIYLRRHVPVGAEDPPDVEIPIEFVINGVRTADKVKLEGVDLAMQGHTIPISTTVERGWGKVAVPADSNPRDNAFYFVFDEAPSQKSVIISDDSQVIEPIRAALSSQIDPGKNYVAEVLPPTRIAEIPWEETALLIWHAPIPEPISPDGGLLRQFIEDGKTVIFLPTEDNPGTDGFYGGNWGEWVGNETDPIPVGWWRTESDLLANTQNGDPLSVGELNFFRIRKFEGEGQPLMKSETDDSILTRVPTDTRGAVYFLGTLPSVSHSSLAREGVVFFVMLHRALDEGSAALANAQQRDADPFLFGDDGPNWKTLDVQETADENEMSITKGMLAGAFENQAREQLVAVNRALDEDAVASIDEGEIENLFAGLDYRVIKDEVGDGNSLASEIWRAFLITMALALMLEAVLCFPQKTEKKVTAPAVPEPS